MVDAVELLEVGVDGREVVDVEGACLDVDVVGLEVVGRDVVDEVDVEARPEVDAGAETGIVIDVASGVVVGVVISAAPAGTGAGRTRTKTTSVVTKMSVTTSVDRRTWPRLTPAARRWRLRCRRAARFLPVGARSRCGPATHDSPRTACPEECGRQRGC